MGLLYKDKKDVKYSVEVKTYIDRTIESDKIENIEVRLKRV